MQVIDQRSKYEKTGECRNLAQLRPQEEVQGRKRDMTRRKERARVGVVW